jgi:hypothetical protein
MNEAEQLLRRLYAPGGGHDRASPSLQMETIIHPHAKFSLFGLSGAKEQIHGRDAFLAFVARCYGALSGHRNEILDVVGFDEQCAFVRARAWRKATWSGEEASYQWAMLYRVEAGLITYGADMLDARAQAFWGRVLPPVER